MTKTDPD